METGVGWESKKPTFSVTSVLAWPGLAWPDAMLTFQFFWSAETFRLGQPIGRLPAGGAANHISRISHSWIMAASILTTECLFIYLDIFCPSDY